MRRSEIHQDAIGEDECPACGEDFRGEPIPAEHQEAYGHTHLSRKVAITVVGSDRAELWRCPDCTHEWRRE